MPLCTIDSPRSAERPLLKVAAPKSPRLTASVAQVFSCNLLSQVVLGSVGVLLIHFMREQEYARLTLALSIIGAGSQMLSGSFNRVYITGHQQLGLKDCASEFLTLQLLAAVVAGVVLLPWLAYRSGLLGFIIAMIVAQCLADYAQTMFQQELRFLRFSLILLSRSLAMLAAVLILLLSVGKDLKTWQILLAQTFSLSLLFVAAAGRRITLRRVLNLAVAACLAKALVRGRYAYLFGAFAVLALVGQTEIWVLRMTKDDLAVATFGTAYRYFNLLLMVLTAVHLVLLPHLQNLKTGEELDLIYVKQRRMLIVFAPLVLVGAWLSQWIIPWIDQGRYPESVATFRILAVAAVSSFALSPYVHLLLRFNDFQVLFGIMCGILVLHPLV